MAIRRIAHRDLKLALGQSTTPLPHASTKLVWDALAGLSAVLNAVEKHYKEAETLFDAIFRDDGVVALLYVLDAGVKAQEDRKKRIVDGIATEEDFKVKEI
jgi:hypothetical protein